MLQQLKNDLFAIQATGSCHFQPNVPTRK